MQKLLRLIALLLFLGAAAAFFAAYAYRAPQGFLQKDLPKIQMLENAAKKLRGVSADNRRLLQIDKHGLMPAFGGGGAVLLLLSLFFLIRSGRYTDDYYYRLKDAKRDAKRKAEEARVMEERERKRARPKMPASSSPADPALADAPAEGGGGMDDILEGVERMSALEDDSQFSDISQVISLFQSALDDETRNRVFKFFRPDILPFVGDFSEIVREKLANQILGHHIVSRKRDQKGISPDQFRIHDVRMNELARETICRRYMPNSVAGLSDEERELIGKVYLMSDQSKVQQDTMSQADDWTDISLRNIADVMATPLPTDPRKQPASGQPGVS